MTNRERLIGLLEAIDDQAGGIALDDGSYIDYSTDELEVGDADGNVVRISLGALAIAVLNA